MYVLDLIARRYGIAPWTIDVEDPATYRYLRRAMIFMQMENDRDTGIAKRKQSGRVRIVDA